MHPMKIVRSSDRTFFVSKITEYSFRKQDGYRSDRFPANPNRILSDGFGSS